MDIKKYVVDGIEVEFVCDWHNTRNGFAHDVNMFWGGWCHCVGHAYYINRTWECFTYQTAMLNAISNAKCNEYERAKYCFMNEHKYNKLTAKRRGEFENSLEDNNEYKFLCNLYDTIKNARN